MSRIAKKATLKMDQEEFLENSKEKKNNFKNKANTGNSHHWSTTGLETFKMRISAAFI
jgi:hypothetical protein